MRSKDDHHFLWPTLMAYRAFRLGLGYTSFKMTLARQMDEFTLYRYLQSIDQLDERFVYDWVHMLAPRRSAKSKNQMIIFARGFFDYLIRQGIRPDNPARRIPLLKTKEYKPHLYSLHEIHQILEEAAKLPEPLGRTLSMLYYLLYACGLRVSEALKLQIRHVDFSQNLLALSDTKFHKERLAPFSSHVAAKLAAYLEFRRKVFPPQSSSAPFFCHINGAPSYGYVEYLFRKIIKRLDLFKPGLPNPRMHDLRRAFAVHRLYKWYQEGHNLLNKLPILSTYMGHVKIKNTQVYLTITEALLREGDKRFQKSFEDIAHKSLRRALKSL